MKIAILHYHLNRGGVTQVIVNHLRALAQSAAHEIDSVAVLFGGRRQGWPANVFSKRPDFDFAVHAVPTLDYETEHGAGPEQIATDVGQKLRQERFEPATTIIHCHNHALGKNSGMPAALAILAQQGWRQLLQIHDFIEDFRPENYARIVQQSTKPPAGAGLYPQSPGIHYAVLNARDENTLAEAGVPGSRLHLMPNPVAEFVGLPPQAEARKRVARELQVRTQDPLYIYPVRGIRRKNLGEMLLLSVLDPRPAAYAVTLAPLNPVERACFENWTAVARDLKLPCHFDIGTDGRLPFSDVVAAADMLLTTSVTEGFGMVFLEAWLAGRPLVGRNLTEITADFAASGVQFPTMYERLEVPVDLVGRDEVAAVLCRWYLSARKAFGQPDQQASNTRNQITSDIGDPTIDFARLDTKLQRTVICAAHRDDQVRQEIQHANPKLDQLWRDSTEDESVQVNNLIACNQAAIRHHYSQVAAGERLARLYDCVIQSPAGGRASALAAADSILDYFLDVRRLHPIRLETCRPSNPTC